MQDTAGDEILLLKHSCKVVIEIANFFTGEHPRAQRAQKRLEKKYKDGAKGADSAAFYANVWADFTTLDDTVQGLPDTWSDVEGPGIRAVCHLLQVLEGRFLDKKELDLDGDEQSDAESVGSSQVQMSLYNVFPGSD